MKHAYAPYSQFKVGAAMLTSKGEIFTGLQRGERILRIVELRRAHCDLCSDSCNQARDSIFAPSRW